MTVASQQPHGASPPQYPTAPPWAAPQEVAAPAGPQAPWTEHGQLLVPYPEEMHNAARPTPPAWWPILPLTFFFGVLGLISVGRRANMARRGRNSVAPYWIAWGLTLFVGFFVWFAVGAVGVPAYQNIRQTAATGTVQENIVGDGQLTSTAGVTATAAKCSVVGKVAGEDGTTLYDCLLTLDGGRTGELSVKADGDGHWEAVIRR